MMIYRNAAQGIEIRVVSYDTDHAPSDELIGVRTTFAEKEFMHLHYIGRMRARRAAEDAVGVAAALGCQLVAETEPSHSA